VMPTARTRRAELLRWHERMSDNYAVRLANEPLAARWAADRATASERRAIAKLGKTAAQDGPAYHRLESAWHEMVARAAKQPLLADVVTGCRVSMFDSADLRWIPGELLRVHQGLGENFHDFAGDHAPIAEAIVERDGAAAESSMRDHIAQWQIDLARIVTLLADEQPAKALVSAR
jgi:DNA-binding FadR family transcriptional regulator